MLEIRTVYYGLNEKPGIVVLSETWFNETNIDNLPGYKPFNFVCTKKNRWSTSIVLQK